MSNRDWERELADIDRRIAAAPDTPPPADAPARSAATPPMLADPVRRPADPVVGPGRTLGVPAPSGRRSWRAQFALLFRIVLGVAIVAALIYWPYTARCGAELAYYLGLVAALGFVGIFTATSAWRHRASVVHLLGLVMLAGAITLGAREVLPKIGYAIPSTAHPASWTCTP